MKNILIITIALCCAFLYFARNKQLQANHERQNQHQAQQERLNSPTGFVALPPSIMPSDKILILAPVNCPSREAQYADRLARNLQAQNIPYERISSIQFSVANIPEHEDELKAHSERMNRIMSQPPPLVFVHGRAKSNPTLHEIIAEYQRGS